jgi:hypothetical protein
MKSQMILVLSITLALPWVAARLFQIEGHRESFRECRKEFPVQESYAGFDSKTAGQTVSYGELSNKQINYLIP